MITLLTLIYWNAGQAVKLEALALYRRMQDANRRGFGIAALLPLHFRLIGNPGTGVL